MYTEFFSERHHLEKNKNIEIIVSRILCILFNQVEDSGHRISQDPAGKRRNTASIKLTAVPGNGRFRAGLFNLDDHT
jgi:hypothetical protein